MVPLNKGFNQTSVISMEGEPTRAVLHDFSLLSLRLLYGYVSHLKGPGVAP